MRALFFILAMVLAPALAGAQSGASFGAGQTLSAAQLNAAFAKKVDFPATAPLAFVGPGAGTLSVTANTPLNGTYVAGGTKINLCPALASIIGCTAPGQFWGEGVFQATSQYGPVGQETTLTANMVADSGYASTWSTSTAYAAGASAFNGANVYTASASGTSASSGGGPSGMGSGIVDGTVTWNYVGPAYANGKQAIGCNLIAEANAAHSWCAAFAAQALAGWSGGYMNPLELDASNFSSVDPVPSSANTINNLFLSGPVGNHPITNEIYIAPSFQSYSPAGGFGAYNGIWINGPNAIKNYALWDSTTGGLVSYYISGSHTLSSINDGSTTPIAFDCGGTYSVSCIYVAAGGAGIALSMASGVAVCLNGSLDCVSWNGSSIALSAQTQVTGDLYVQAPATNANQYLTNFGGAQRWDVAVLAGANGGFQLFDVTNSKTPFSVAGNSPSGSLAITNGAVTVGQTLGIPAATWADNQTCVAGQISVDASFLYVCTATNTVKRVALSSF